MKNITTAFSLTPEQDRTLRIEAAKRGLSKTKFSQTIIEEWINGVASIRQRYDNILAAISTLNEGKDYYFDTLDRIVTSCCDCMEFEVKSHFDSSQEMKERYLAVIDSLASDVKIINDFCETKELMGFGEPTEELARKLVKEFFESRI